MDIVLEQIMLYVDQIAGLVSDSSPMVWEMLLAQVKVHQAGFMIFVIIGGVGLLISLCFIVRGWVDDDEDVLYSSMLGGFISAVVFGVCLYGYIARNINPAWYAIKLLLSTVGIGQ